MLNKRQLATPLFFALACMLSTYGYRIDEQSAQFNHTYYRHAEACQSQTGGQEQAELGTTSLVATDDMPTDRSLKHRPATCCSLDLYNDCDAAIHVGQTGLHHAEGDSLAAVLLGHTCVLRI